MKVTCHICGHQADYWIGTLHRTYDGQWECENLFLCQARRRHPTQREYSE